MAGPLGVSHLLLFSRSTTNNTNLRLAITPRGPTLHFRVEKYSLCKDVRKAMKHPKGGGKEYSSPPLLVMNNFTSPPSAEGQAPAIPKHLESLTTTIFQSLFPPISPRTTPLSSIRRILLLNRELPSSSSSSEPVDNGSYIINLRHYAITTKRTGLPRSIRRLNAAESLMRERKKKCGGLPNLSKLEDVADYLLDPTAATGGFTSASETEVETDAEVEVLETTARIVLNKRQLESRRKARENEPRREGPAVEKRAVKLVELGPRMKLRLIKVEEGVCNGKVMWHEFLHKSKEEEKEMEKVWEQRKREKDERKRIQKENIERKRAEKGGSGSKDTEEGKNKDGYDNDDDAQWDSEGFDDEDNDDDDDDDDDDDEEDNMEVDKPSTGVRVVKG